MSGSEVRWQVIVGLGKKLGKMGPSFTDEEKTALALVFDAAGNQLAPHSGVLPFDAKFVPGKSKKRDREAFKIEGLFPVDPELPEKGEPKKSEPPDLKSSKE
ncbi:hypothetical protein [Streptomyces sp. RG80]|uniref:hypothetical protein n=1 Tax=Streptomyces sp. RG80 TaxID=3157340 RepID=UPI00338EAC51